MTKVNGSYCFFCKFWIIAYTGMYDQYWYCCYDLDDTNIADLTKDETTDYFSYYQFWYKKHMVDSNTDFRPCYFGFFRTWIAAYFMHLWVIHLYRKTHIYSHVLISRFWKIGMFDTHVQTLHVSVSEYNTDACVYKS